MSDKVQKNAIDTNRADPRVNSSSMQERYVMPDLQISEILARLRMNKYTSYETL